MNNLITSDDIRALESNSCTGRKSEVFLRWVCHKILTFDINLTAEWHIVMSCRWIFRIVFRRQHFRLAFRIICDHQFERIQHSHSSQGSLIKFIADTRFQQFYFNPVVSLSDAYFITKYTYGCRRIASSAHSANGGHTWVIPSSH